MRNAIGIHKIPAGASRLWLSTQNSQVFIPLGLSKIPKYEEPFSRS